MYTALIIIIMAVSVLMILSGIGNKKKTRIAGGISLAVAGYLFFWLMDFWGEMLWFNSLGYENRFWKFELTRIAFAAGGFVFGYLVIFAATFSVRNIISSYRYYVSLTGGVVAAIWGDSHWDTYLRFINRVSTGVPDPVLDMDTGFYMFTLPFLDSLVILFLLLIIISLVATGIGGFTYSKEEEKIIARPDSGGRSSAGSYSLKPVYLSLGMLTLILAIMKFMDRYHLLFSDYGVVSGPGWTDVNVRLPAMTGISLLTLLVSLIFFFPALRRKAGKFTGRINTGFSGSWLLQSAAILGLTFLIWFLFLTVVPGLFQMLRVEPNELRAETPYIVNNIEFTRKAFAIDRVEEREFSAGGEFTEQTYEDNQLLFSNIRLWDYRALQQVYKQFQEIRLYYEFNDVDIDRYLIDDEYRQVMVSAREMELRNLPPQSQTFINERFIYTHGMGITLTGVSEFTENGLPDLLIRDIPPVSRYPELEIDQPRIYYGELTRTHVIANSNEQEFDYPMGSENQYYSYTGEGGVEMSSFWRKILFGWKFDGTRLLFSGAPNSESRILFNREIRDRLRTLAPFLQQDDDPYIVLADGRLKWIFDAYTTSSYFPYSESYDAGEFARVPGREGMLEPGSSRKFHGENYLRNSVKAVIDAYTGKVDLYIFDEEDPVIQVWEKIVPGLFKDKDQMPEILRNHIRYPLDMLLTQGLVYAKYHMTDPGVFYNQEDLWVRATENYYGNEQPVEPYYIMWDHPGNDNMEYILMQPYTPKGRQVLVGWIAGMSDGENYGRFLAYNFPRERRILGPQQFETKIDQDAHLSGQLSLWDQRGSRVIRGNVLAIPVGETLIYVEPIYLQAEAAAYPELRLVAMMHGDRLSYAETFEDAVRGLFEDLSEDVEDDVSPGVLGIEQLIQQADQAFEDYIRHTGNKEFDMASQALRELEEAIQEMGQLQQPEDQ